MSNKTEREILAFYLPQFHRVKENDNWWGEGFTDWRNAKRALPRFKGHWQPHLPGELGEYDLADPTVIPTQWKLAQQYGVTGFCFYHYWFHGQRMLESPVNQLVASGNPENVRFCLCWANESWTRSWDGQEQQILLKQEYSNEDNHLHIEWLLNAMRTPGYIQVNEQPVLLIYRPDRLLKSGFSADVWQRTSRDAGFKGLSLIGVSSGLVEMSAEEILKHGFSKVVEFAPNRADFGSVGGVGGRLGFIAEKILPTPAYHWLKQRGKGMKKVDYVELQRNYTRRLYALRHLGADLLPCCFPSWDNSPRRDTPTVIQNLDAQAFGSWVKSCVLQQYSTRASPGLIFINAWNEWGEGCHLEPDFNYGRTSLEALKAALSA